MSRNAIKKSIELDADFVKWYGSHFPEGSLTALINMLCGRFMEVNQFTPADYAEMAAKSVTEDLKASL